MQGEQLQKLGLTLRPTPEGGAEVDLPLSVSLVNPLSHRPIRQVTLAPFGDRLIVLAPPDLVGLPALSLEGLTKAAQLEQQLATRFDEYMLLLQRKSQELQALGLSPKVNLETLQLTAEVQADVFLFTLAADKRGNFRVAQAIKSGKALQGEFGQAFELSEFRERQALTGYLIALVHEPVPEGVQDSSEGVEEPILFEEILARFGPATRLPARSALEMLVAIRVKGVAYRFAAARVMGRTFRGLLAGPLGKIWAERFELQDFPGVVGLVSQTLHVPVELVELMASEDED